MAPNDLRYQGNSDAREFGAVIEANGKNSRLLIGTTLERPSADGAVT